MAGLLNKKAQTPEDIIYGIVIILMIGIGGLIASYAINEFTTTAGNFSALNNSATTAAFQDANNLNNYWDYIILVVLIAISIGVVVLGYFLDVHSVFLPLYIISMLIGVIVAGIGQYIWNQVSDDLIFTTIKAAQFPITDHILTNLALYFTIIAAMGLVATYAKTGGGGRE